MEKRTERHLIRIAVTGPESTGKSVLSSSLAAVFNTVWVEEYARAYLEKKGPVYTATDIEAIARGQIEAEERLAQAANRILFCDTDLLVCRIWYEHAFGDCPLWLLEEERNRFYDHTYLMDVDLPWQPDPLREHPYKRVYFFDRYRHELEKAGRPYSIISGAGPERLQKAVRITEQLLSSFPK